MRRSKQREPNEKNRLRVLEIIGVLAFVLVFLRTFYWQIIQYSFLSAKAASRYSMVREVPANRGNIYAWDGSTLATNVTTYDVSVVSDEIKDKEEFSKRVAPFLLADAADILTKISKNRGATILKHSLDKDAFETLRGKDFKELIYTERAARFYPEKELFAHNLGFVNLEGKGQYSMEEYFDGILSGEEGLEKLEVDVTRKKSIPLGDREYQDAIEGATIYTTLDVALQDRLLTLLEKKVKEYKADNGLIIVMETKTGAIPALVQFPTYDPNNYSQFFEEYGSELFQNLALANYEPGSVFKIITMASGLDSDVITPHTTFYDTGKKVVGKDTIYNWDKKEWGYTDMTGVLVRSSNIGAAFVAEKMGKGVFNKYIQLFGFGKTTGIEMMGEQSGIVNSTDRWSEIDLDSIGFGQGIGVTPIQLIAAVNAIANGGNMMKPRLVDKIIYKREENVQLPRLLREHVVSEGASKELTDMLVQVVRSSGTELAQVPGYTIAGKTGTAQVVKKGEQGYEENKVIGSFVGYAPAYNPKYIILVRLDLNESLEDASRWGSQTAAPTFAEAAKIVFNYYGVPAE